MSEQPWAFGLDVEAEDTTLANLKAESDLFRPKSRARTWLYLAALTAALILGLVFVSIKSEAGNRTFRIQSQLVQHCGSNASQAIGLGCRFDLLSAAWTPERCMESVTTAEYYDWIASSARRPHPFPYYEDSAGSKKIMDVDTLSKHEGVLWTTQEEHLGHCIFLLRRLHRALNKGIPLVSRLRPPGHTFHCSQVLLEALEDRGGPANVSTAFAISFASC